MISQTDVDGDGKINLKEYLQFTDEEYKLLESESKKEMSNMAGSPSTSNENQAKPDNEL